MRADTDVHATAPVWTALIAWSWTGKRASTLRLPGLVTGVAGVVGRAYVLYFRLIAHAGAADAMTATLLVPALAIALGLAVPGRGAGCRHTGGLCSRAARQGPVDRPAAIARSGLAIYMTRPT